MWLWEMWVLNRRELEIMNFMRVNDEVLREMKIIEYRWVKIVLNEREFINRDFLERVESVDLLCSEWWMMDRDNLMMNIDLYRLLVT